MANPVRLTRDLSIGTQSMDIMAHFLFCRGRGKQQAVSSTPITPATPHRESKAPYSTPTSHHIRGHGQTPFRHACNINRRSYNMAMYLSIKSNEYDTLKALRELLKYGKNAFYASQEAASYATDPATKLSIEKIRNTLRDVVNLSDTLSRDLIKASARKEELLDVSPESLAA
jgi:hypothetical protein